MNGNRTQSGSARPSARRLAVGAFSVGFEAENAPVTFLGGRPLSETTPKSITDAILALQPGQRRAAVVPVIAAAAGSAPAAPEVRSKTRKKPRSVLEAILAMQPAPIEAKPTRPRWGRPSPEQRAALERAIARLKAQRKARRKPPAIERIAIAMLPGHWYSKMDVVRSIGGGRGDGCRFEDTLRRRGLVVRGRNAAWPSKPICVGRTWRRVEPRYFYKLSPKGEMFRDWCILVN
jgi:hypothetical protein